MSAALASIAAWGQTRAGNDALRPDDLVRMAVERNKEFLATKQRIAEAQGLLRQAGVRPSPTLEVEQSTGRPLGTRGEEEFSAGYFHTFEMFGKREKRLAVAQKSVDLAEAEIAERTRQLTFDVKMRYAEAVAEQRKLEAVRRLLELNRQSYRITEVRVEQGDAAPLERQLLLTDLSRAEAQQATFSGRVERALLEVKRAVGLSPSEPLALAEEPLLTAMDLSSLGLKERALQSRPDLRILRFLEQQSIAEVDLIRAEAKPNLTASARYSHRNSSFDQLGLNRAGEPTPLRDRDNIVTFGLSVPILRSRRNQGALEAALARVAAARLRREHVEASIRLEVEVGTRRWTAAKGTLEILNRGVVRQSEQNLAVIRESYSLGQLRLLDVLNEQRRLIETQLGYIDAESELFQSVTELERAVGGTVQ